MVLSANLRAILTNEGIVYPGLDAEEIAERTAEAKTHIKSAPVSAKTNNGIRLGMSKADVRRVLGPPKRTLWSKRFQADELVYSRETAKDDEGVSTKYSNYYLFKGGKLFYVELAVDAIGGP